MERDEAVRMKELDTLKSHLFTNLTHEFRTPLTVILGMTNQLSTGNWKTELGQEMKQKVSQALKLIENNGKNLLLLINQLLDLSKLENNSFKLHSVQSDIVPYLRYLTESFQSYADDINLSLRFSAQVESLVMDFDPEQIKQILTNLISNALKFTPAGGKINVELSESSGKLQMAITDTGIGIAPKDLPHVLERFYQADNSNTRVTQGTGIGLAHTQELVKIIGGTISIESEIGTGTRVLVHLPVTHDEIEVNTEAITLTVTPPISNIFQNQKMMIDESSSFLGETSSDSSKPQLLIIEDSPDVVVYLKYCLEHAYAIRVATNGKAGIEKAIEEIPDFIISDVMMPEKDGYQVCDTLKNDERTSHIPIILLTAKADAASRITGLRRGADAYLAKPFDPEELQVQIAVLLDNRRRMAAHFSKAILTGTELPPDDSTVQEVIRYEDPFVNKVRDILEANYAKETFDVAELCLHLGMSRSKFFRKLKAVADTIPSDLIRSFRLSKAKAILKSGQYSVAEVTFQVGFKDPSYFSKIFHEEFGVLPSILNK
jgi:DNA-binding response OmpR family regulator/two-component sensor histidine kinase